MGLDKYDQLSPSWNLVQISLQISHLFHWSFDCQEHYIPRNNRVIYKLLKEFTLFSFWSHFTVIIKAQLSSWRIQSFMLASSILTFISIHTRSYYNQVLFYQRYGCRYFYNVSCLCQIQEIPWTLECGLTLLISREY